MSLKSKRKVQQIGDSYWVSLPIDWCRRYGIKPGDTLIVEYTGEPVLWIVVPEVPVSEGKVSSPEVVK